MNPRHELDSLLRFLYRCPVGIAETSRGGETRLLNAVGTQIVLAVTGGEELGNLLDLFARFKPELPVLVARAEIGDEICRSLALDLRSTGSTRGPEHLDLTVVLTDADTLLLAFTDETKRVRQDRLSRAALQAGAHLEGRLEMATRVLHDVGNAITGLRARSTRTLQEPEWPELIHLRRLRELCSTQGSDLTRALGLPSSEALLALLRELEEALLARSQRQAESLRLVAKTTAHIQDVLAIEWAAAQGPARALRPTSLATLAEDALALQRPALELAGIQVRLEVKGPCPETDLDPTQILRLLQNLIRNAQDALSAGAPPTPQIVLTLQRREDHLELSVRDNGVGFEPAGASGLFVEGYSSRPGGAGVGLATSRSIAAAHGGSLELESPGPGEGAIAKLVLPVSRSSP